MWREGEARLRGGFRVHVGYVSQEEKYNCSIVIVASAVSGSMVPSPAAGIIKLRRRGGGGAPFSFSLYSSDAMEK